MNHLRLSSTKNWLNNRTYFPAFSTLKTQVFSLDFLIKTTAIAFVYLVISSVINDYAIYANIVSHNFPLLLTVQIVFKMFLQSLTMFGPTHTIIFTCIAIGVGINMQLVIKKLQLLKTQRNVQWTFGAGILTLASSSCPGCGFSLLSITGLTSALPGIPFQGNIFSLFVLLLLIITCSYNLYSLQKVSCSIR